MMPLIIWTMVTGGLVAIFEIKGLLKMQEKRHIALYVILMVSALTLLCIFASQKDLSIARIFGKGGKW